MAADAASTELAMIILILINEYMTTTTNILLMIAQLMDIQQSIVAITKKRRRNSAAIACYLLGISPDKKPRVWIKPRSSQWWDESVPKFSDEEFISNFRVDRNTFNYLVEMVKTDLTKEDTRFREAIPVTKKVGVALKMLGSNCNYGNLAGMFGVGRSTIHDCLKSFLVAANKHLVPKHIKWPDEISVRKMAEEFEHIWQFPMVIGVLEAYHIPLSPPREIATNYLYYNAKETYSVIVLAICDAHGKFWWLKSGIPGRHDISTAFRDSTFYKKASSGAAFPRDERPIIHTSVPYLILGDSGFGLEPWLIEPYMCHETLSPSEIDFNCRVSSARGVADTAFARVKGRWRRLLRKLDLKMESVTATIDVCVALHNMCEDRKVPFDPKWLDTSKEDTLLSRQPMYSSQGSTERAKQIRNALRDYFAGDCPTCTPQ